MSKRFKRLQGALESTRGDRTRSLWRALGPEARNAKGGPQGRAGPGAQPALLPRPRRPARGPRGPRRPSRAGGAALGRHGTPSGSPSRPFRPRRRSPGVDPAAPTVRTSQTSRLGSLLASRPSPAAPARPPPELRPHRPRLRPPPGTSPAARSPACGGGGPCAERRAPIARIGRRRDPEQDGALLLARRLGAIGRKQGGAEPLTWARRARS